MSQYSRLASQGLTNSGTEDYGVIASVRRKAVPYCTSPSCCVVKSYDENGKEYNRKYKRIKASLTVDGRCSKCGYDVFWSRD